MIDKDVWVQYENYAITRLHYSPATLKVRLRNLRHLSKNGIDLINFDENQVYNYLAKRIKAGTNGSHLNMYLYAVNSWVKFKNITYTFKLYKKHDKPIKIPTSKEIYNLLKCCTRKYDKRIKTIIFLLSHSGLRVGELVNLKTADIDYSRNTLTVTGKGYKTRVVPVKPYVISGFYFPSINNYIKYHRKNTTKNYIFTGDNGQLTPKTVRKDLKKIAKLAGITWIHPHSLRHYYATTLIKKGVNIKIVQILLGHSTIKTTSRYLHMLEHDIFQAIANITFDDFLIKKQTSHNNNKFGNFIEENLHGRGGMRPNYLIGGSQLTPLNRGNLTPGGELHFIR